MNRAHVFEESWVNSNNEEVMVEDEIDCNSDDLNYLVRGGYTDYIDSSLDPLSGQMTAMDSYYYAFVGATL